MNDSLSSTMQFLYKRIYLIIISTLILTVLAFITSTFFIDKRYESVLKMNYTEGLEYNLATANTTVISRTSQVVKSNVYLSELKDYLDTKYTVGEEKLSKSYSQGDLFKSIETTYDKITYSIVININTKNANDSYIIAKSMYEEDMLKTLSEIVVLTDNSAYKNYKAFELPIVNEKEISPNVVLYTFFGFFIGLCLGVIIALIVDKYDSKIKNPESIKENFNVSVIGIVPNFVDKEEQN